MKKMIVITIFAIVLAKNVVVCVHAKPTKIDRMLVYSSVPGMVFHDCVPSEDLRTRIGTTQFELDSGPCTQGEPHIRVGNVSIGKSADAKFKHFNEYHDLHEAYPRVISANGKAYAAVGTVVGEDKNFLYSSRTMRDSGSQLSGGFLYQELVPVKRGVFTLKGNESIRGVVFVKPTFVLQKGLHNTSNGQLMLDKVSEHRSLLQDGLIKYPLSSAGGSKLVATMLATGGLACLSAYLGTMTHTLSIEGKQLAGTLQKDLNVSLLTDKVLRDALADKALPQEVRMRIQQYQSAKKKKTRLLAGTVIAALATFAAGVYGVHRSRYHSQFITGDAKNDAGSVSFTSEESSVPSDVEVGDGFVMAFKRAQKAAEEDNKK